VKYSPGFTGYGSYFSSFIIISEEDTLLPYNVLVVKFSSYDVADT